MKNDRQTRAALLLVTLTLALSGATLSTTTGTFVDREVIDGNEIEAGTYGTESETTDVNQSEQLEGEANNSTTEEGETKRNENETDSNTTNATAAMSDVLGPTPIRTD